MLNAFTGPHGREARILITSFAVLVCAASTFYFAYFVGETIVYTHLYYIPVVLSGLWYRRNGLVVPVALVAVYLVSVAASGLPVDADIYLRSAVLILVGLTIGELSNLCSTGRMELAKYKDGLEEQVKARTADLSLANEKLALMGKITRHDTLNTLSVLSGWLELARDSEDLADCRSSLEKAKEAETAMRCSLEFAVDYERVGAQAPQWLSIRRAFESGAKGLALEGVEISNALPDTEVYADPMLDKVFRNLIDNSVRHGGGVRHISALAEVKDDRMVVAYSDDGVGIRPEDREHLFELGYGKHTGFGMYFAKKALEMTGITIEESGAHRSGVRFLITVPPGGFRASGRTG